MISLTSKAVEKFNETINKSDNPESQMLRVSFEGFGWGGPEFELTLDELKGENDIIIESNGVKIVYDSEFEYYLNDAVIGYSDNWFSRGFTISGRAVSSCS